MISSKLPSNIELNVESTEETFLKNTKSTKYCENIQHFISNESAVVFLYLVLLSAVSVTAVNQFLNGN